MPKTLTKPKAETQQWLPFALFGWLRSRKGFGIRLALFEPSSGRTALGSRATFAPPARVDQMAPECGVWTRPARSK